MTRRDVRFAIGVFVVTLLMFARLIFCDFTWWDDPQTIHHNPLLNPPTWAALGHYWTAMGPRSPMGLYVPVTYTLWWLLAWAAQAPATVDNIRLSPMVFHGANVLLHAVSAVLVFLILRRLSIEGSTSRSLKAPESRLRLRGSLPLPREGASDFPHASEDPVIIARTDETVASVFPALAGALLFAIHPVQVETVAWASGTKDLLCGLFMLIAIERYIRFTRSSERCRAAGYAAVFIAVLLGMLSKPTAVIAPLLLMATGYFALGRTRRQLLRELWPMFALMIPCAIIARWSQPATFSSPVPIFARPLVAADAITFYFGKLLWPMHLSTDYGRSPAALLQAGHLYSCGLISLFVIVLLSVIARRWRKLSLAMLLFVIPLLPVLGLQPFLYQYHSTVTDHYLYLPVLGMGVLLAVACSRIPKVFIILILISLGVRTLIRESAWQNTRTLFGAAVADDPTTFGNFDMLGFTYALDASRAAHAGDVERAREADTLAIDCYAQAIALNPLDVPARDNLARVELNLGNRAAAVKQVKQIIALQPQLPEDLQASPADLQRRLREYSGD